MLSRNYPIIDTSAHSAFRLFRETAAELFLHPPDLSDEASEIPDGPIEGWEAFAPAFDGDPSLIIGPFTPVVVRPYEGQPPSIVVRTQRECTEYILRGSSESFVPEGPLRWYQSGLTLRFIRKKPQKISG